jgi:hypothetical protein
MTNKIITGIIIALAASAAVFLATNKVSREEIPVHIVQAYKQWTAKFNRLAATPEEQNFRLKTFYTNFKLVEETNNQGLSYTLALNDYADMTSEEFAKFRMATTPHPEQPVSENTAVPSNNESNLAQQQIEAYDWISYLPYQSLSSGTRCNDNYAWIASTTYYTSFTMQGFSAKPFSPQTYIDCSGNFNNGGCAGGWASNAFQYSETYGIDTLESYQYAGIQNSHCFTNGRTYISKRTYLVPSGSNSMLAQSIRNKNIVAAAVDLSWKNSQFYAGGVFSGPCQTTVSENVMVVGFGTDPRTGKQFWKLVTTMGAFWGDRGVMYIEKFNIDNDLAYSSCGLNLYANFPLFK